MRPNREVRKKKISLLAWSEKGQQFDFPYYTERVQLDFYPIFEEYLNWLGINEGATDLKVTGFGSVEGASDLWDVDLIGGQKKSRTTDLFKYSARVKIKVS